MTSTTDTTQHPDVSEISDLTEGLLSPSRTADVRQHLDGCPLCADVRTALEEIRGLLGTLPGAPRMPAAIAERIDAALAAEALLDATAPEEAADVSRETVSASQQEEVTATDRPAGRPRAATGPGRSRQTRRRRTAVLGAVFTAAAVGVSVLLLQSIQTTGDNAAKQDAGASSVTADAQEFSDSDLQGRVQTLLAKTAGPPEPRVERAPSSDSQSSAKTPDVTPKHKQGTAVPSCIQKGTGRADAPLAFERGMYEGTNAYLVVMPHTTDSTRVQAYVVDAACVGTTPTPTGKLLLADTYPRR